MNIKNLKMLEMLTDDAFEYQDLMGSVAWVDTVVELRHYPNVIEKIVRFIGDAESEQLGTGAYLVSKMKDIPELWSIVFEYLSRCPSYTYLLDEEQREQFWSEYVDISTLSFYYYHTCLGMEDKACYMKKLQAKHGDKVECFYHLEKIQSYDIAELYAELNIEDKHSKWAKIVNYEMLYDFENVVTLLHKNRLIHNYFYNQHTHLPLSFFTIFENVNFNETRDSDNERLSFLQSMMFLATGLPDKINLICDIAQGFHINQRYWIEFFQKHYDGDFAHDLCERINKEECELSIMLMLLTYYQIPIMLSELSDELDKTSEVLMQVTGDKNLSDDIIMEAYFTPFMKKNNIDVEEMDISL